MKYYDGIYCLTAFGTEGTMIAVYFIFEERAIDFTRKLDDAESVCKTFETNSTDSEILSMLHDIYLKGKAGARDFKLAVGIGKSVKIIPLAEICRIERVKRKLCIYWGEEKAEFYGKLELVEEKLEGFAFARINNYCIISLNHIKTKGRNQLEMKDGTVREVSKKYAEGLRRKMAKISSIRIN